MRKIEWEITLNFSLKKPVLALGSELKNTICVANKNKAFISSPLQNLEFEDDYDAFAKSVFELPKFLNVKPEIIAYDFHPDFISTKFAKKYPLFHNIKKIAVQHHIAHIASCAAAENINPKQNFLGIAFDGTGYGTDGTMWGGEFFLGNLLNGFKRVARLKPIELPGSSAAILEPWRTALALTSAANIDLDFSDSVPNKKMKIVKNIIGNTKINSIFASSFGRLFDGISAMLGICLFAEYEAQAAILLEKTAGSTKSEKFYPFPFAKNNNGIYEFDWIPMVREIANDLAKNIPREKIAAAFHDSITKSVFEFCIFLSVETIVAAGGVFLNKRLTSNFKKVFSNTNLILPKNIPTNDAAVSLGQAIIATPIQQSINPLIHSQQCA